VTQVHITPEPSEEEVAAIVAAVEAVQVRSAGPVAEGVSRWRWSGRWWSKPIPQRRIRPW